MHVGCGKVHGDWAVEGVDVGVGVVAHIKREKSK